MFFLLQSNLLVIFLLFDFPGPGRVLFQVLHKPPDSGNSDRSLLAGRRSNAEGVYQQSEPLWSLQELSGAFRLLRPKKERKKPTNDRVDLVTLRVQQQNATPQFSHSC